MDTCNRNNASDLARAFAIYSLVPYLGILFCPGALVMGSIGLARSYRMRVPGGREGSYLNILMGVTILIAQVGLWWILYKVPEWSRGF